jgi:hypothetical protein
MSNLRLIMGRWCHLAAGLALAVSACASGTQTDVGRAVYVSSAPPEPLPEFKSGPPAPGMTWLAGYWHFNGSEYVWIPGHWESPRPGAVWKPPAVVYSPDQHAWIYQHGRWETQARAVR